MSFTLDFLEVMIVLLLVASVLFSLAIILTGNKWKRLLSFSMVSAKVIMLIVLYALLTDVTFYLDVALVYALLSHIGIIVIANYMLEWRGKR